MFRSLLAALGDHLGIGEMLNIAAFAKGCTHTIQTFQAMTVNPSVLSTHDRTVRDCDIAVNLLKKVERVERVG